MRTNLLRGNLDLVLLIILAAEPKYGLEIISEANERTGGYFAFKEGSVYPALHRLEKSGFVTAAFAPSDTGGPRRRYYSLTPAGRDELEAKRREWETFTGAIRSLLETI
jgi:DNA-binding PadR family transcriptional regulator